MNNFIVNPYRFKNGLLNNLISYYSFATDGSDLHGSNDLTVYGATQSSSGGKAEGGYYSFDGVNDYLENITGFLNNKGDLTINFWAKSLDGAQTGAVISYNEYNDLTYSNILQLRQRSGTEYLYRVQNDASTIVNLDPLSATNGFTVDDFHMYTLEIGSGGLKVYRDLVLDASNSTTVTINNSDLKNAANNVFALGCNSSSVSFAQPREGYIGALAIYDGYLTSAQKTSLYNSGFGFPYSNFTN